MTATRPPKCARKPDGPLSVAERNAVLEGWLARWPRPVALLLFKRPDLMRRARRAGFDEDEVNSACLLGAACAARLFDPARGARFHTYALYYLVAYTRNLVQSAERDVERLAGREVRSAGDAGEPLGDLVACEDDPPEAAELEAAVRRVVAGLPPCERRALEMHFGFAGTDPLSQVEVGRRLGVSRGWVRYVLLKSPTLREMLAPLVGEVGQ